MNVMATERLFDISPYEYSFSGQVLACEAYGRDRFSVALNRTAFYPEGGGQPADRGTLAGFPVLDVQEKDGIIWHTLDKALEAGTAVEGTVDEAFRWSNSQQHTGEHILSGLTCARHSCSNVGFHIGSSEVTLDFNVPITWEEALSLEEAANRVIWKNVPVKCFWPTPEELASINYRSKKALTGPVRIVQIEGADTCACCGTHVPSTGCVGQIKLVDRINYKGGVRLSILCGDRALAYENALSHEHRETGQLLSAKAGTHAAALRRLLDERDALKEQAGRLSLALFEARTKALESEEIRIIKANELSPENLCRAAGLLAKGARAALVLLPTEYGCMFALCSDTADIRAAGKALCAAFSGKGGGNSGMVQGRLSAWSIPEAKRCIESALAAEG